jgi:hypothetical protein
LEPFSKERVPALVPVGVKRHEAEEGHLKNPAPGPVAFLSFGDPRQALLQVKRGQDRIPQEGKPAQYPPEGVLQGRTRRPPPLQHGQGNAIGNVPDGLHLVQEHVGNEDRAGKALSVDEPPVLDEPGRDPRKVLEGIHPEKTEHELGEEMDPFRPAQGRHKVARPGHQGILFRDALQCEGQVIHKGGVQVAWTRGNLDPTAFLVTCPKQVARGLSASFRAGTMQIVGQQDVQSGGTGVVLQKADPVTVRVPPVHEKIHRTCNGPVHRKKPRPPPFGCCRSGSFRGIHPVLSSVRVGSPPGPLSLAEFPGFPMSWAWA